MGPTAEACIVARLLPGYPGCRKAPPPFRGVVASGALSTREMGRYVDKDQNRLYSIFSAMLTSGRPRCVMFAVDTETICVEGLSDRLCDVHRSPARK